MRKNLFFWLLWAAVMTGLIVGACAPQQLAEPTPTEKLPVLDATGIQVEPKFLDQAIILSPNLRMLNPDFVAQMKPAQGNYDNLTALQLDETGGGITISKADLSDVQFQFQAGQIISAGITEDTPYGLLRKVVSVQEINANTLELITEQATLEEAIQDGAFTIEYSKLIASSTDPAADQPGDGGGALMQMASMPSPASIIIPKVDVTLYDDGKGGKIMANVSVEVTPDFDLTVVIADSKMENFVFVDKTIVEAEITITSGIEYKLPVKPIPIYDQYLQKIWFEVAGLPVVITPRLVISIGLDGKVAANITMGAKYKNTITMEAGWMGGEWILDQDFSPNPVLTYSPPAFKAKLSARIFAQARLELMLYGLIGPYAQLEAYFKYDANPEDNPWWTLKAGVDAVIGITSFKLFGFIKIHPLSMPPFNLYLKDIDHAPLESSPGADGQSPPESETVTEAPPSETEAAPEPPPMETEAPAPMPGKVNFQLVYDDIAATLINISQEAVPAGGIEFRRISDQGSTTASFLSDTWRGYASGGNFDALPPNDCLTINTKRSPRPSNCEDTWAYYSTSQAQYQFWLAASDSRRFQVWQNGILLQTCEIAAGSCSFSTTAGSADSTTGPGLPPVPQPQPAGNENVQLVYDDISANLINISPSSISLGGIEFRQIDAQGSITASFLSDTWKNYTSNGYFDALPPNDCLRINTQKSLRPANCEDTWAYYTTSQAQYHFWLATSGSRQFQVWKNGTLLQTCEIADGSCTFLLPQP